MDFGENVPFKYRAYFYREYVTQPYGKYKTPWKLIIIEINPKLCKRHDTCLYLLVFEECLEKSTSIIPEIHTYSKWIKIQNGNRMDNCNNKVKWKQLPKEIAMFNSKMCAIDLAVDFIARSRNK